jgi:hypothetical protein
MESLSPSLREKQRNENHQTYNLPDALGGLGDREQVNNDSIPQELSDESQNYQGDDKSEQYRRQLRVRVTALGNVPRIHKSLNSSSGRTLNNTGHFLLSNAIFIEKALAQLTSAILRDILERLSRRRLGLQMLGEKVI